MYISAWSCLSYLCVLLLTTQTFSHVSGNLLKLRCRSFVQNYWFLSLCLLPCSSDLLQIGGNLLSLIPAQIGSIVMINSTGEEQLILKKQLLVCLKNVSLISLMNQLSGYIKSISNSKTRRKKLKWAGIYIDKLFTLSKPTQYLL